MASVLKALTVKVTLPPMKFDCGCGCVRRMGFEFAAGGSARPPVK